MDMRLQALILALSCGASALAGCEPVPLRESTEVSTRDLQIGVDAIGEGSGAEVVIRIGSPLGAVKVAGGDSLRLTANGVSWALRVEEADDGPVYVASLGAPSGDLVIDLERPSDRSVLGLAVAFPPPFTLTVSGSSAGEPFAFAWEAAEGTWTLGLSLEGACIEPFARPLAKDTGSYAVDPAELRHRPGAPATCPLEASVTRSSSSQRPLIPGVEGGWFNARATQTRAALVSWDP
jgi:hypothetical protein